MAGAEDWSQFHKRIGMIGLPQVPDASVVAGFAKLIEKHDARVLLLGVTRALTGLGQDTTAVDWSQAQLERLWPGDGPGRRAILADWREMRLPRRGFSAAIGDGSLSTLIWPEGYAGTLERVAEALEPGGRLALRCFVAPAVREPVERIADDVFAGREPSFHAARWRIAMAASGEDGNVVVGTIRDAFDALFPDRAALAERTGWDLAMIELTIGAFRESDLVYSFVTRAALAEAVAPWFDDLRFVASGDYPLAERCPFLVAERAG